ncbi:hypothetical protein HY357_01730 [Candidatus Roizmanbacteria bacterium]|nr:hypothetical protein [Candidatus Roizmanbacteria bacterium]
MKRRRINLYPLFPLLFIILTISVAFSLPPTNIFIVLLFISLLSLTIFSLIKIFIPNKSSYLLSFFIFLVLLLRYFELLDGVNLALLISLFIGILILLK